ncbi:MAG: HD domain-containing protein [Ilyomonas sp.]
MKKDIFEVIENRIIARLDKELDNRLHYHNSSHTVDVIEQTQRIAKQEGIKDAEMLSLLKIAALYHDTGFLFTYTDHELEGCEIARKDLQELGVVNGELETISGLILATKVPQKPQTHLQQIICDADLDYLGRGDYNSISSRLKKELLEYGFIGSEKDWLTLQINFLESHTYFTSTSQKNRSEKKNEVLLQLKEKLQHYKN